MKAANRKAPAPGSAKGLHSIDDHKYTTVRGRRAIGHLWAACRAVHGASLTADDMALIREALAEIAQIAEVRP